MATVVGSGKVKLNNGQTITAEQGAWYDGQQYWGGTLSEVGVINSLSNQVGAGQRVSDEVIKQSNPANLTYINNMRANQLQSPAPTTGYTAGGNSIAGAVTQAQSALDSFVREQTEQNQIRLDQARQREQETLDKIEPLVQPFREDLEASERERLYVNENFEANQQLTRELDQLLSEGNALIRQQQSVTGLASVRNPRVQQTMEDVAARAGVIEAVINVRNNQISVANNMIDRTVNAISADRQDQINYYNTILELNNRDILSLDARSRELANTRIGILQTREADARQTANYVKELMMDPATALLAAQAGVSLNDSVETINQKLAQATYTREVADLSNKATASGAVAVTDPSKVPANQLITLVDSQGNKHYYQKQTTGGGTVSSNNYLDALFGSTKTSQSQYSSEIDKIFAEALNMGGNQSSASGPPFTPTGGVGAKTIWNGANWQYTNSGWKKI